MSRAAMQQALEALIPLANAACPNERECLTDEDHERAAEALEALRAALAEPEQEPVGYWDGEFSTDGGATLYEVPQVSFFGRKYPNIPVYAAPTPRRPLSDEQFALIVGECAASAYRHDDFSFARAIERAHGIGEQHE